MPGVTSSTPTATRIDPRTWIGAVRLVVTDLERVHEFYERSIGLSTLDRDRETARLGIDGDPLIELVGRPDAPPRPPRTTGLFHLAVLVPSRAELARAIRRVVGSGWRFSGASDHLVSEALYTADPEGNGIEIYRDRPREEWPYLNGTPQMATEPLDLDSVLAELPADAADTGMAPGTRIGHVHLQVADLAAAESFYHGLLGFDVTVRGYPGALFVSAGGYHHHIGLNTWASEGAPAPPPGSRGLAWFEVELPSDEELARVAERLAAAGTETREHERGVLVADPSGNGVLLTAAGEG
jgi:catechol 2,3-dioxygenase